MKDQPPTCPSFAATVKQQIGTVGDLVKNKNFLNLWIAYSMYMGVFNGFGLVIAYMIEPFGYDSLDASLIGSLPLLVGIIGAVVISKKKLIYLFCLTLIKCLFF